MPSDVILDFSSTIASTVLDKDGEGTGFTSVQPNTANNAYDLGRIDLNTSASSLVLTATQGSNGGSANTLKNALQLPVDSTGPFTVSTRLIGPFTNLTAPVQQGGIFLGSDQDNYVKFVIVNSSNGLGLQFYQEQNGVRSSVGGGSGSQVTGLDWANVSNLDLFLTGNPAEGVVTAAYRVNSDTLTPTTLTQEFTPNSTTSFFADEAIARAGILAFTKDAADTTVTFDNFGIQYPQPPALGDGSDGNIEIVTPDAAIVQNRMVFSTVNEEVRAPKTLTISNTGTEPLTITGLTIGDSQEKDNAVRLEDHERAADFTILNAPTLPFTLSPGAEFNLDVEFAPQRVAKIVNSTTHLVNAENYASLTITSDDADQPTTTVNLAGLNWEDYEGAHEPSVAEVARSFGWTINIGTEDYSLGGDKTLLGDEVYSPYWLAADPTQPVLLWPLSEASQRGETPHNSVRFEAKPGTEGNSGSIYKLAGSLQDDSPTGTEVLGSNDLSGGENQKLLPKILVKNVNTVPTAETVGFTPTGAFALNRGGIWTDDSMNGPDQLHNWRIFPVRDAQGTLIPNTWYAIADPGNSLDPITGKNFDYNDSTYLLVNAKPESAADPSVGGLFPGAPGLMFDFNTAYPGSLMDKDAETIGFTSVQTNKNETFTTNASYFPKFLDINTSGSGTLSVTTGSGSNGSDNTLANALQTTFDGRAGEFTISTRLVGPLSNITTSVQQGGVMFGPDQDNYIKLVAIAQSGDTVGLQFYSEQKGVGTTIGPIVPISSPETLQFLDLMLIADPQSGTVQAAYRSASSPADDTGIVVLPDSVALKGGQIGHYFAAQSEAGIIAMSKNAEPITVTFDRFAIAPNKTTTPRTVLYRLDVGSNSNYTDTSGNVWTPDDGLFTPDTAIDENGDPDTPTPPISLTNDDTLYQTYRGFLGDPKTTPLESRVLSYNLPVNTPVMVDLQLHFAELYYGAPGTDGAAGPGQRVFDIKVEGVTVLENFDITAASGGALRAVVVPIEGIEVTDGVLNLEFKPEVDFAAISAIEVFSSAS